MPQVSRPLLALLVAVVGFFGVWLVALNPSSGGSGASPAVRIAPGMTRPHVARRAASRAASRPAVSGPRKLSAAHRVDAVSRALAAHKVVALLFYNPVGADDRAVEQELRRVPLDGGRVVRFAVPLAELSRYSVVTSQVPVTMSPTLVLVDGYAQATTITGFADGFEIAQRVADALRVR